MGPKTPTQEAETIRGQAKMDKSASNRPADRSRMDKDVVKAVLASPLSVPWPNIPIHLQATVISALPRLVPPSIADYHLSRARCQKKDKRVRRNGKRAVERQEGEAVTEDVLAQSEAVTGGKGTSVGVINAVEPGVREDAVVGEKRKDPPPATVQAAAKKLKVTTSITSRPSAPAVLNHLVLGINETIKSLEHSIDDLKIRLFILADSLNATHRSSNLLPTAPRSLSPPPSSSAESPLMWILIPLQSISPQSLVSPIPQYCATFNALVYQHDQLAKVARTRLKEGTWDMEPVEEVRVVPVGRAEVEMAEMVGLRRLACLGIRASHPEFEVLKKLLPKSVLHPPRHSITLPFPTSGLKVHTGEPQPEDPKPSIAAGAPPFPRPFSNPLPIPHVHYAPLQIKGITTIAPADGSARKQRRLEEVRKRRVVVKERKRKERNEEVKRWEKGLGKGNGSRNGRGKGKGEGKERALDRRRPGGRAVADEAKKAHSGK